MVDEYETWRVVETTKLERCCSWRPELRKATVEDKPHRSSSNMSIDDDGDGLEKDFVFRNMVVVYQNSIMIILLLSCGLMD